MSPKAGVSTQHALQWILTAQERQIKRSGQLNGLLSASMLMTCTVLKSSEEQLLANAIANLKLSPRGVHKVLRVARTIADLETAKNIQKNHLLEALSYRRLDMLSMESQQT
jgi:magnesium chelatase family protein